MATSRATFGAVLTTISTTAATITETLQAANASVGMLNVAIQQAAINQKDRAVISRARFREELIRETSYEEANSTLRVTAFRAQSAAHDAAFQTSYARFSELLNPKSDSTAP